MSRFTLPASLAVVALLLVLTIDPDDSAPLTLLALLIMAVALALFFDPAIEALVRLRRAPGWRDAGLFALCLPLALAAFSVVELFLPLHWRLAWGAGRPLADGVEWGLQLIVFAAPLVPLVATAVAPRHAPETRPPLWPLGVVLAGGVLAWMGGALIWLTVGRPLMTGERSLAEIALPSPAFLAMGMLGVGIGVQFWWRAVRERGQARFDERGMFRAVIMATAAATVIGLGLVVLHVLPPAAARKAVWLAGWQTVPLAAVWAVTLWRVRRLVPTGPYRPIAAVALLLVTIPLTYAPAQGVAGSAEWAELVALLSSPLVIAACVAVALIVPRLTARLLGAG